MALITEIPAELLLQIISELDKKDISAISRSRKALQQVVHPFLYETITWTLEERFSNIRFWEDGMAVDWKPSYEFITPPIHFLLRIIIEKPPLNMSIKTLGFTGRVKSVYHRAPGTLWNADSEPELTASEFDAMRHLVRATEMPEE